MAGGSVTMRYFQQVLRYSDGSVLHSGAFRRPFDHDRGDQLFHAVSKRWKLDPSVHRAELGYRDDEFVEVDEVAISAFLTQRFPEVDVDAVLAEPPQEPLTPAPSPQFASTFVGGAGFVPIESGDRVLGDLWWSDDDTAAGVAWRRVETRDEVPTATMEWWSRRLWAAAAEGVSPAALVSALEERPAAESGSLRRDLAGHVASIEALRERAGLS